MGRILVLLIAVAVAGCGSPSHTLEPAFVGQDRSGFRVIVYVPNERPETVREAAAEQVAQYRICPSGFDLVHTSRRQQTQTLPGNWILNVVVACR